MPQHYHKIHYNRNSGKLTSCRSPPQTRTTSTPLTAKVRRRSPGLPVFRISSPTARLDHIAGLSLRSKTTIIENICPRPASSLAFHIKAQTRSQSTISPSILSKMAWRSSGATNTDLIENLWRNKMITTPVVKSAFLSVDRAHYAPSSHPYDDSPKSIGHGATISAPHMHASAVENLLPYLLPSEERPAPRVLDIGSGSGYLTHALAEVVGDKGVVVGVEHISQLKELGEKNMGKSVEGKEFLSSGRARFRVGDGRRGWVERADDGEMIDKWDAIHVGASAATLHDELLDQLKSPGRMFIPVDDDAGGYSQHIWCVDKDADGQVEKRKLFGVRYVPLTDAPRD